MCFAFSRSHLASECEICLILQRCLKIFLQMLPLEFFRSDYASEDLVLQWMIFMPSHDRQPASTCSRRTMASTEVPKFISGEQVNKLLDWTDLLSRIESALGNYSKGKDGGVVQPVRLVVPIEKHHG